jgi:hypothetical protein
MQPFVHRGGQQLGPFTEAEVRAQLAAGTLSPGDLVWWEGQGNWVALAQSPYATTAASSGSAVPPVSPIPAPGVAYSVEASTSGLAIGALVCGIIGVLLSPLGIVAVILGHQGLSQTKRNPALKGGGMALAGLVLGYIELALMMISIVAIGVLIALGNQVQATFKTINQQIQSAQSATNSDTPPLSVPALPATNTPNPSSPTNAPGGQ